jgi:hypothetical protein
MRAREFIKEAETREPMRKSLKAASKNITSYPNLDNNNNPYLAYRFGVALAPSPDTSMDTRGPFGSSFTMVDFSDADTEIRKGAEKMIGVKSSQSTGSLSKELANTNVVSPVSKPKNNKYGI